MEKVATAKSHKALFLSTTAITVCFAVWMLNGVLVTFLVSNQVFDWGPVEIGWLLGIFGAGNAGAALTTLFAPSILNSLTDNGTNVEAGGHCPSFMRGCWWSWA